MENEKALSEKDLLEKKYKSVIDSLVTENKRLKELDSANSLRIKVLEEQRMRMLNQVIIGLKEVRQDIEFLTLKNLEEYRKIKEKDAM